MYELRQTVIADARLALQRPCIDREGFGWLDAPTAVADFLDVDSVTTTYSREAAELALAVTGAAQAYVFDHLRRRHEHDRAALSLGRSRTGGFAAANRCVDNDYTEASGRMRLARVLADPNAAARARRYGIVNVWGSIRGPVVDTPLAICGARTLTVSDLAVGEVRYPRRAGEGYVAMHSPSHRSSCFPEMDRDEALVFKQYDSQHSGVARFTPHTAFDLPDIPIGASLQASVELRCLVVYDSET